MLEVLVAVAVLELPLQQPLVLVELVAQQAPMGEQVVLEVLEVLRLALTKQMEFLEVLLLAMVLVAVAVVALLLEIQKHQALQSQVVVEMVHKALFIFSIKIERN
jgi:hypothetical protein